MLKISHYLKNNQKNQLIFNNISNLLNQKRYSINNIEDYYFIYQTLKDLNYQNLVKIFIKNNSLNKFKENNLKSETDLYHFLYLKNDTVNK
ncbi:hypothetical protein [[Mycoplasma] cavipharyngis]|uniref:hypothetical protein n=1 Tax=[Mycoplasma] cavipharyngis TaxID=92757 RepID=UPI0037043EB4